MLDNPDAVDPGGIQQGGDYFLALARHFGNRPLDALAATPSLVAFNALPGMVIRYPVTWALPLAALVALLFAAAIVVGVRRGSLRVSGVLMGLALFIMGVVATLAVTALAWMAVAAVSATYHVYLTRGFYGLSWHIGFLVMLTVAAVAALYLVARRLVPAGRHDASVAAGALAVPVLLAIGICAVLPAASYLFVWPALAGVLLLGWGALDPARSARPWLRAIVLAVTLPVP